MAINAQQSIILIIEFLGYYKVVKFNYGNVNHIHFYLRLEKVLAKREISDGYHFSNILVQTKKKKNSRCIMQEEKTICNLSICLL